MQWVYDIQPGSEQHIPFAQSKALALRAQGSDRSGRFQIGGANVFIHVRDGRALIRIDGFAYGFYVRNGAELTLFGSGTLVGVYAPRSKYVTGTLESFGNPSVMPVSVYNGVAISTNISDALSTSTTSVVTESYSPSVFRGTALSAPREQVTVSWSSPPKADSESIATYGRWGAWSGQLDNGRLVTYHADGTTGAAVAYESLSIDSAGAVVGYIQPVDVFTGALGQKFNLDAVLTPVGFDPAFGFVNQIQLYKSRYVTANSDAHTLHGQLNGVVCVGAYSTDAGATYTGSDTPVTGADYGAYGYAPTASLAPSSSTLYTGGTLAVATSTGARGRAQGVFYMMVTTAVAPINLTNASFVTASGVVATQFNVCTLYKTADYGVTYTHAQGDIFNTAFSCPLYKAIGAGAYVTEQDIVGDHQTSNLYATTLNTLVRADRWNLRVDGVAQTYSSYVGSAFYVTQDEGKSWRRAPGPPISGAYQDAGPPEIYGGTLTTDPTDTAQLGYLVFEVASQLYKFFVTLDSCTSWVLVWSKTVDELGPPVARLGWLDNVSTPVLFGNGIIKPDAASWT